MTATDERRKSIDFSDPYAFTGLALLVSKDSDIQSIEDLKKPGRTHRRQGDDHRRELGDQQSAGGQARGLRGPDGLRAGSRPGPGRCVHLRPAQHLSVCEGEPGHHARYAQALRRGIVGHRHRQGQ